MVRRDHQHCWSAIIHLTEAFLSIDQWKSDLTMNCISFVWSRLGGTEREKGIGGWRGKERKGTKRGDYRRHGSLCERLSLARQGGGTLWILMNWQDSPQNQLHLSAARGQQEGRRRWLERRRPSTANQTEQVIFPVIIMAITRHEGLVMDLLILHALHRQPLSLSRGKAWWCVFFSPRGRVTPVRVAVAAEKGSRGTWPLREKLTNELHYWGAYQGDPLECVMYYPASNLHTPPTSPI